MLRILIPPNRRLGPTCLGLLLVVAGIVTAIEPSPVRAATPPAGGAPPVPTKQATDTLRVPPPARDYALDMTKPGCLPTLSTGLQAGPNEAANDGSYYRNEFETPGSDPDPVAVESVVYILIANDKAEQMFDDLLKKKHDETGADPQGAQDPQADRASTYAVNGGSGDSTVGAVLRYRNAVGLVEIRGRGQHATAENARELANRMFKAFVRGAQRATAPPR